PQHERAGSKLCADIHGAQRLLQGVRAHARIVGGKCAVPENGIEEQVDGGHRHDDAVALARAGEILHDAIPVGRRRVDRDEIVVVQIHAPGAHVGQHRDRIVGRKWRAHGVSERIASSIADGPEAERKLVLRARRVLVRHHCLRLQRPAEAGHYVLIAPTGAVASRTIVFSAGYTRRYSWYRAFNAATDSARGLVVAATRTASSHAESTSGQIAAPTPARSAAPNAAPSSATRVSTGCPYTSA